MVVIPLFRFRALLFSFILLYTFEMKVSRYEAGDELLISATDKIEILYGQDELCTDPSSLETYSEQFYAYQINSVGYHDENV